MKKINFDDLYVSASSGNKEAYDKLFLWFQNLGISIAKDFIKTQGIYSLDMDEMKLHISELFLLSIRSFGVGKIPFQKYSEFLLRKRIPKFVVENSFESNGQTISLDSVNDDGIALIDTIESNDYQDMVSEMYADEHTYRFASSRFRTIDVNENLKSLIRLKKEGYRKSDICKMLNLSEGQYRYLKRVMNKMYGTRTIEMK